MSTHHIRATFENIYDRGDLVDWDTTGVYINLGGDPVRTARVGEGWVKRRAAVSWLSNDRRVIACDLGTHRAAKVDSQAVESLVLLEYEWRMGRLPRRNLRHGNLSVVARLLRKFDRIAVTIRGYSPLNGRRISAYIKTEIHLGRDGFEWHWG